MTTMMAPPAANNEYKQPHQRWRAICERDASADGRFVYAVATTGVYCRPSCAARRALRRNVTFFDTSAQAERQGFRPCLRCSPNGISPRERQIETAVAACRLIESASQPPSLELLADAAGLGRHHFLRMFKKIVGVTPGQYAAEHRDRRVKTVLRRNRPVTRAIHNAGFNSSGRFYERAPRTLGMTPGQFRKGGEGVKIMYGVAPCRLGLVLVGATARGVCCIKFADERESMEEDLRRQFPQAELEAAPRNVSQWLAAIVAQLDTPCESFELPLDVQGTAFQQRVWRALCAIPAGQTRSYQDVARNVGNPKAVRAVARACASNPVALVVPCHRVVGSDGKLHGYRWGVERKRKLLEWEKRE